MYQSSIEEGETRMGCFSDTDDNIRMAVKLPTCPKCGSHDYQVLPSHDINCQCAECGFRYYYNFNQ